MNKNLDEKVVEGFGDEWSRFDQSGLSAQENLAMFNLYFDIFPWHQISKTAIGFDLGCGSGRWAKLVAPRIGMLHCIDPSDSALNVAKKNLSDQPNCQFYNADVSSIPLEDETADFGYSLGVLHHIPDPESGLRSCVNKLKDGAPFLLYLYYSFDNRSSWFKAIWTVSEYGRSMISKLPYQFRYIVSQLIAFLIYFPLARAWKLLDKLNFNVEAFPLSAYRDRSFYVMRNDALDRFGTALERRFSKNEILQMMEDAGLENITFSDHAPYWCALGYKQCVASQSINSMAQM